jgi:hypothetical protein
MKTLVLVAVLLSPLARADEAETLCAGNPAFSLRVMQTVVEAQLQQDHDPALDNGSPEQVAEQARTQGISECAADMRKDPSIQAALTGLGAADLQVGWDAYNTSCADHRASRGACIAAEIAASKALKHMASSDQPAGAKALVQTCELVLQSDPAMVDWRQCVDQALAVHPTAAAAKRCRVSVTWHVAKTGAEAGQVVAECLRQ